MRGLGVCLVAVLSGCGALNARADFTLKGRTVNFYVGGGAGGGVDQFARVIAPYLGKYAPGSPQVTVIDMGASGGLQGVQYLYNVAAQDGSALGTTNAGPISEPLMGQIRVNYDIAKFRWAGSITRGDTVCALRKGAAAQTLDDVRRIETPMAATGATSAPTRTALLMNALIGAKFKPAPGYDGGTSLLAVERGEVDGLCTTLGSLRTTRPQWLENGSLRVVVQVSLTADPQFPQAPRAIDLVSSDEPRKMLEWFQAPYEFNNPVFLPPGASDEALQAWRAAFDAAVRDPDYRAEAAARLQRVLPHTGAEVAALVTQFLATPRDIVERVVAATDLSLRR